MKNRNFTIILGFLTLAVFVFIKPSEIFAAQPWQAEVISQNQTVLRLKPGKSFTVSVKIKNIGVSTWQNSGDNFVALNTFDKEKNKTVKSKFENKTWKKWWRPTSLAKKTKPNETAEIKFIITAPKETGIYSEKFSLAKAGYGFIDGGNLNLTIISFPDFTLTSNSSNSAELEQSTVKTFNVALENTSNISWNAKTNPLLLSVGDLKILSQFTDNSWTDNQTPCQFAQNIIKPKQKITCQIKFKAPDTPGSYRESFFVKAKDMGIVTGSRFFINFNVTPKAEIIEPHAKPNEPLMRVGLFSKTTETKFKANGILDIIDSNGVILQTINSGDVISVNPINKINFSVTVKELTTTFTSPLRFIPRELTTISEMIDFERRPVWNSTLNDNLFRGIIEMRMLPNSATYWAIEEVALEEYLRGIAEVSDSDNFEYLKTLLTAARTYALFLNTYKTKHKNEGFDVNMTSDQVYRGYNFELRSPNVTKAVLASEGQVIIHEQAKDEKNTLGIIVASYSSGTDGKTRRWCEVWKCSDPANDYPWALSVDDPLGIIPNALTLLGNHMVGLSAKGARAMAIDNIPMEEILKYYYTGVEIKKIY